MDIRTGRIHADLEKVREMFRDHPAERSHYKPMEIPPTAKQLARKPPKVGRNDRCPCGSGRKFKKCCLEVAER